jgi:four helix bundle protein
MKTKTYDLEDRLVNFSVKILELSELLPKTFAGKHLGNQLIRSGTSPALNYGEAQAAESPKDFLHKLKVCLKELRESQICLRIIFKKGYCDQNQFHDILKECTELVAIFTASVKTTRANSSSKDQNAK